MSRPYSAVPRPTHHPVLGHLPEWVGKRNAEKLLETLLAYAEDCGPMVRIPFGPARLMLLSDPEPIAELLTAQDANVKGWPYILTRVVLDNVLLLNGDAWSKHRSVYRRALMTSDVPRAGHAAIDANLARFAPGTELDLVPVIQELVADCVVEMLCHDRYDRELDPHRARVQYELAAVGIDLQCQPWAYFSPQRWVAMRRSVGAMRAFFRERVDARLAAGAKGREPDDVLSGFLRVAETGDYPRDPEKLTDGLVNFFFTAHDVLVC
jgi:cytochrome P450